MFKFSLTKNNSLAFKKKNYFCEELNKKKTINLNFTIMAYVINDDCIACGACVDECPVDAISEGDIYKIDPELCTDCGACADVCPTDAISPE